MRVSEQIQRMHDSGDVGLYLTGYAEKIKIMEDAIVSMVFDGWLDHGSEGMSEAQELCHKAYAMICRREDVKK